MIWRTRIRTSLVFVALALGLPWLGADFGMAVDAPKLPVELKDKYTPIGWGVLAGFAYTMPEPEKLAKLSPAELVARNAKVIPENVRALSGSPVALQGFLFPIEWGDDGPTTFILSAKNDMGCCFGINVAMNEWAYVEISDEKGLTDVPDDNFATVVGRIDVGERVAEGYVESLYRVRADRILFR